MTKAIVYSGCTYSTAKNKDINSADEKLRQGCAGFVQKHACLGRWQTPGTQVRAD